MKYLKLFSLLCLLLLVNFIQAQDAEPIADDPNEPIPMTMGKSNQNAQLDGTNPPMTHKLEFRPLIWRDWNDDMNWTHTLQLDPCKELTSAQLFIRAFDIDWPGYGIFRNIYNFWEHDRVTVDGTYLGDLEGRHHHWSTTSFNVDVANLTDGTLNVNLNIDATFGQFGHPLWDWDLVMDYAELVVNWQWKAPVAAFDADPIQGVSALEVAFTNNSVCAEEYLWDFGDGTTSTEVSPTHTFVYDDCTPASKDFVVKLTAKRGCATNSVEKTITVYSPAVADFEADLTKICSGTEVTLTNKTCGAVSVWELNWGDGTVENGTFPVETWKHTYTTILPTEKFTVTLKVEGKGGTDTETKCYYITVHGPVVTDFVADVTYGTGPMTVNFTDLSQGWITWWKWDFGDDETSTEQNPTHVYQDNRKHCTVTLTSGGPCGESVETKVNYITINRIVSVDFDAAPIFGAPGMEVQFANKAGGNASHFEWTYGDGVVEKLNHGTVNKIHPKHVYAEPGEYSVSLKAWGDGGMDMLTIPGLIYIDATCQALPVGFVTGGATSKSGTWAKAIDNDIQGTAVSVEALTTDAWGTFIFADSAAHNLQKVRVLVQTMLENEYCMNDNINNTITEQVYVRPCVNQHEWKYNLVKKFEVYSSDDGENFVLALEGECEGKPGLWEIFELPTPVSAKYLKVKLYPRDEKAKYAELAEIQFMGDCVAPTPKMAGEEILNSAPVTSFELGQNYPNPFNPQTAIQFNLPEDAEVTVAVYNTQGQLIQSLVTGHLNAGVHNVVWNATDLNGQAVAGGVYVYKLNATSKNEKISLTKKMIYMK
jgi:PKD repeat protein